MSDTPMLFPIDPQAFWERMKELIEKVINEKLQQPVVKKDDFIPKETLLKISEVCSIFRVTKPTVYEWMRLGKLKSFKIERRRYFVREHIEAIIRQRD